MTQIAVKLPDSLVQAVDELVSQGLYATRSAVVRSSLEAVVAAQRRLATDSAYTAGYQQAPESNEEVAEATRIAIEAVNDEPWEKWW